MQKIGQMNGLHRYMASGYDLYCTRIFVNFMNLTSRDNFLKYCIEK